MTWLGFLIGVLVGWLGEWFIDLFFWRRAYQVTRQEKEALEARLDEVERRLATFRVKGWDVEDQPRPTPTASVAGPAAAVPPDVDLATPEEGTVEPGLDDLELLEGIGPKISQLLRDNGVLTFAQLAGTSIDRLQAILETGGPNYRLADPGSWPEQAALAADGAWDELRRLQERLVAGRKARRAGR